MYAAQNHRHAALLGLAAVLLIQPFAYGQSHRTRTRQSAEQTREPQERAERSDRTVPPGCYEIQPGLYIYPPPSKPVTGDRVRPSPYYVYRAPAYYERSRHFTERRRAGARPSLRDRHPYDYRRRGAYRHSARTWQSDHYGYGSYGAYGYHHPYAAPPYGYHAYEDDLYDAYEQGRYDADNDYLWWIASARAGRLLDQSREKFDQAIIYFRDGKYDRAAINMLGAAEKNQADPASRLHAGHALFALGQYDEAVRLLARAFELSPSLAYKNYDIRDEYGEKTDFDRHLLALKAHVDANPKDASAVTLLGYVIFYTEGPGPAHPYLARAAKLNPLSYFIPKIEKLARYASKGEAGLDLMPPQNPPEQPQSTSPVPQPWGKPDRADDGRRDNADQRDAATTHYERGAV